MGLRLHLTPLDGLPLLVILIWGGNFSLVKVAIEEIPTFGFNTLRMAAACLVLLTVSGLTGPGCSRSASSGTAATSLRSSPGWSGRRSPTVH